MLASGASAADDWTGFYVGANVGVALGKMTLTSDTATTAKQGLLDHTEDGSLVGLQLGANWQFRHLVMGFEADHSIAQIAKTKTVVFGPNGAPGVGTEISVGSDVDYVQTIRGRIGDAAGRNLFFVTGGISGMRHTGSASVNLNGSFAADTDSEFHKGQVVGVGYERKLTDKLSLKGEYLRLMAGSHNYVIDLTAAADGGQVEVVNVDYSANILRFGVNFHF